jgi:predicted MFS family arabinose efflux permease
MVALIAADAVLAAGDSLAAVAAGIALWGLHMGLTQGLFAALVADSAPAALRGTAFGVFNLASGVALLIASWAAGLLWDASGPDATFRAGAVCAALALAGSLLLRGRIRPRMT